MQKTIFCSRLHYMARKNPSGWEGFVKLRNKGHIMVNCNLKRGFYCMNPTNRSGQTSKKEVATRWQVGIKPYRK